MTRRPDRLQAVLDGMATDLDRIHDDLAWAHNLGWDTPAQARPDGTRGASLSRPIDEHDTDHVAGAKYDTGLGDHRARQAVRAAAPKLERAARNLAAAIQILDHDAELLIPAGNTRITQLQTVTRLCRHRANYIAALLAMQRTPAGVERATISAHVEIRSALGILSATLNQGPIRPGEPDADLCRICQTRPSAPKKAGRCNTCDHWYYAHGKRERPRALDQADVTQAVAAQQRRRSRGQGWGAA